MLISSEYAAQQAYLHEHTSYGTAGEMYAPLVSGIVEKLGIDHLLDYGCGKKMSLAKAISCNHKLTYQAYDPGAGLEELATVPVPAQLVCCIDVLEHIEPESLDEVLDHLQSLTQILAFLTIHTGPAMKTLPDGRNAHLTQQPMEWWLPKIWQRWELHTVQRAHEHGFYVLVRPKGIIEDECGGPLIDSPIIVAG